MSKRSWQIADFSKYFWRTHVGDFDNPSPNSRSHFRLNPSLPPPSGPKMVYDSAAARKGKNKVFVPRDQYLARGGAVGVSVAVHLRWVRGYRSAYIALRVRR